MSSLDQEQHNHHTLNAQTDQHLCDFNPILTTDAPSLPQLPDFAYTQPSVKGPKASTAFVQKTSSVRSNGTSRSDSPDPHDFYRRHQDQYRASLAGSSGQGDIRVEQRESGMAGNGQRTNPVTTRSNAPKLPPLTSRIQSRYNTSPNSDRSPLSAPRSSPSLSNTARNRQTSLKDLVNKFNQTPDEALPLPKKSSSRSPSANSNAGGSSSNARVKSRNSSLSTTTGNVSGRKSSSTSLQSMGSSNPRPRRGRTNEDSDASPRSKRTLRTYGTEPIHSQKYSSQSTTSLGEHVHKVPRRPLFGEILAIGLNHPDPGFTIPRPRPRRGSEGSMHSPNPMFPQERGRTMADGSPASPSAWYLGVASTLEEIKTEKNIPDLPANIHRRTRSDFSGAPSKPPTSRMYGNNLSPSRDPPSSSSSTTTSKRSSQSRIPVSTTRRLSTASDSGNSTHSARVASSLGRPYMRSPKIPRYLPKPRSPPRHSRSSTPQRSPRGSEFSSGISRPTTSPLLTAYISAPMPKKSPPLRSSRPRQPVSNASTSASRARVVERFSGHENGSPKNTRETKPRRPPELAGVDFAARRQKIQLAVTKTVKEEERKDEQRRASMALSIAPKGHVAEKSHAAEEGDTTSSHQGGARAAEFDMNRLSIKEIEDDFQFPAEDQPNCEFAADTGHISERSGLDMSMEDSPTLGTFDRFSVGLDKSQEGGESTASDVEPSSAITACTSDSVDTFFDDEPQDDSQDDSRHPNEHQDSLDQVTTIRDPSICSDRVRQPHAIEKSTSEGDDRESIQIMLGETPVLEHAPFNEQQYEEDSKEPQLNEGPESRWSMSSWTSSNKSKDEREAPMERIDEYSPTYPARQPHLSISTYASQNTPQPWSPQSFTSPRTARTTMDSDAYSTINRVLDHYHGPSVFSPEQLQDVQQHSFTRTPELARQGGWDPKKVTALYMQELAKEKYGQSVSGPDAIRFHIRQRTSSLKIPEVPEKEVREDHDEKMLETMEREGGDPTPPATNLYVDQSEFKPARASLTRPDDWDMSPSLGGLHLQAEAGDSPSEDKPMLPPKDRRTANREVAEMADHNDGPVGQSVAGSHPQLPPIEGLGLAINIMPPQRTYSPNIPPPLPSHSPPPPPAEVSTPIRIRSPPSPGVYAQQVPPRPPRAPTSDPIPPPLHDLPASDSFHRSRSATPSVQQPSSSSSVTQDRALVEPPSTSTGTISKNPSPSLDQKQLTRRRHIIKELVDTEHSFGQDMKVVDDIYKGTANVIVMTPEDVKTLFGNSEHIVAFSTNFLDALKQGSKSVYVLARSKRWRSNRVSNATSYSGNTDDQSSLNGIELSDDEKDRKTFIGEQFIHHMPDMEKVYTEYLRNHDLANQKLQALQKNPKVGIWLKECRAYAHDLTSAWDLDSLLVKPVQRILKYPLLLDQLVEATPVNHPDYTALDSAAREMKGMAKRIDEMKKRADVMEQVNNTRKRKESDVRVGLSKAFGRRTEKLRQQVGLSDMVDDKAYSAIKERYGAHLFQLHVVKRDVQLYTDEVHRFMENFSGFASSIEAYIDVGQTSYPELESKWRKFRMSMTEMSMTAAMDHVTAVRKNVIEPMLTLIKINDGPHRLMDKRTKRVPDYARFKAFKDRGDKPDKKTIEQGEQFQAINDTLKEELPKLFALTGKLVEACLNNFVQLQLQWQVTWRRRLSQALDDHKIPAKAQDVVESFTGNFAFFEAQVLSLGVCNGSMLNDLANQSSFTSRSTTLNGDDGVSVRQPSQSSSLERRRTLSVSSDKSPMLPQPDFGAGGGRSSGSFFPIGDGMQPQQLAPAGNYITAGRLRASSTLSAHSPRTPEVPGSYHSFSNSTTPVTGTPGRPSTATPRTYTEPSPAISRPSIEAPSFSRPSEDSTRGGRTSGTTYATSSGSFQQRDNSDSQRYSGFFSSAMPMSDSPPTQSPAPGQSQPGFNVIFLAASVYEFNIDRARKEAGYPYLTYVAGEIFDVIGEKGELWLAKNQDDGDNLVGWIWNKHFVKLAS